MNIAFVTPEFVTESNYDGGLANYLGRLTPELVKAGHDVTVVVTSTADEHLQWQGVRVHRVMVGGPPLFFLRSFLRDLWFPLGWLWQGWKLSQALQRLHRQMPFDIVQYSSYAGTGLFRMAAVPTVVRLSSYEPLLREAWGVELTLARRLQELIEQQGLKRADALFSPSQLIADAAVKRTGRQVAVIESNYAPPVGPFDDRPFREALAGSRYLLFFGSIGRLKGVATIAEIIRPLLEAHPELKFVFVGKDVGDRGRPMMQHVWEMAGSCRGRVLYLGKMPHAQLVPVLQHTLAVILPSRIDNLPNTCIEAMAQGKVVIGTRGASFEQLIDDGENGLLCDIDDAAGLKAAVERVLQDPEASLAMGERARQRVGRLAGSAPLQELMAFYSKACAGMAAGSSASRRVGEE